MDKTLHYIVILSVAITATQTSCCREYKWGGVTGLHFFICCDNSNDIDKSCIGTTYQGGGSTNNYCDTCGQSNRLGGGCVKKPFVVQVVHDRISVDVTVTEKQMDFIKIFQVFAGYGHTAFGNAVRKLLRKGVYIQKT